jgi:protein-tyrosine phosphatase/membrane-associated phospholipid phosphatase
MASMRVPDGYGRVARRAALWLALLAPFFYATYGAANWLASTRADVPSIVTGFDRMVPFLAWTIVPYWSINLFYGLSLFVNDTTGGVDRLARRLLTAQIVAVTCFVAFPLQATFVKPETTGLPGFMFEVLGGFDMPYNQAPSLHIALLVILWSHFASRLGPAARMAWHLWCLLIGVSVLTTWQHHVVDVPTGALLGLFALWLFPERGETPLSGFAPAADARARRIGSYYAAGAALVFLPVAVAPVSFAWTMWLLWPALALAIVAFGYLGAGAKVFQKRADGSVSLASRVLMLPARLGARLNAALWTRGLPASVPVMAGVHLGRFPRRDEGTAFASVVDLTAELAGGGKGWRSLPMLDLVAPTPGALAEAADAIEAARGDGPVLVCCALGFQRSAGAIACWMVTTGRVADRAEALAVLAGIGRRVHLPETVAATAMEITR